MEARIDPSATEELIMTLASYGEYDVSGIWRPAYSSEWNAAQEQIFEWCEAAGLRTYRDAVGNVWGRLEGTESSNAVVTGSHIDTQLPGGRYDGALGVIAGILAISALKEQYGQPKRSIEVVSLCQEESSRFPTAHMWGSRAVAGAIEPGVADTILDYDGVSIADAMRASGLNPDKVADAARDDINAFIELHVEQDVKLEQHGVPVGVVKRIKGWRQYRVELLGLPDHASVRPMDLRRDAMAGAAEIISDVIDTAHQAGQPAVTTVGRLHVEPNLPGVVPAKVTFIMHTGHIDPDAGEAMYAKQERLIREVASRRDLQVECQVIAERPVSLMNSQLVRYFEQEAIDRGLPFITMDSQAGHDAIRMSQMVPTVMLLVQSKGGRSHSPEEFTSVSHAVDGIWLLAAGLYRLAYEPSES